MSNFDLALIAIGLGMHGLICYWMGKYQGYHDAMKQVMEIVSPKEKDAAP
jgi:hypothetical protein